MRYLLLFLLLFAHAAPALHLEVATSRDEALAGDLFTVDSYLFNDGTAPQVASLYIQAPEGFDLIKITPVVTAVTTLAPGRSMRSSYTYRVREDAPKGDAQFAAIALDNAAFPILAAVVYVRVQPIPAPPAQYHPRRLYLPAFRA